LQDDVARLVRISHFGFSKIELGENDITCLLEEYFKILVTEK
jgi:hypothetical protein